MNRSYWFWLTRLCTDSLEILVLSQLHLGTWTILICSDMNGYGLDMWIYTDMSNIFLGFWGNLSVYRIHVDIRVDSDIRHIRHIYNDLDVRTSS